MPVLAIKGNGLAAKPLQRLLLPTDFSPHSTQATNLACALAKRYGAHIDIVHVLSETPEYLVYDTAGVMAYENRGRAIAVKDLEAAGEEVRNADLSAKTHMCKGVTADVIAQAADRLGSDLIVMGTHGFAGLSHVVIGSVAERTLRLAPCSVLTARLPTEEPATKKHE